MQSPDHPQEGLRFMTRAEVLALTGVTYPTLWQWIRDGRFPPARELSKDRIGWISTEVLEWAANRPVRQLKDSTPVE